MNHPWSRYLSEQRGFLGARALRFLDDLRGAGLARDDDAVDCAPMAGAVRRVDHVGHRAAHFGPALADRCASRFSTIGGKVLTTLPSSASICLDELRFVERAAVGNFGRQLRQLHRRHRDVALPDRDRQAFPPDTSAHGSAAASIRRTG